MRPPRQPRIRETEPEGKPARPVTPLTPRTKDPAPPAAVSMTPRLEERERAKRHALYMRGAAILGGFVIMVTLGWGIFFSPAFALELDDVQIETLGDGLTDDAILDAVSAFEGVPITRLRMSTVEERVREDAIALDALATRSWPRGLSIEVTARVAVAAVPAGSLYQLFDHEGVALHSVEEPPEGLPVIDTELDDGTGITVDAILTVLGEIPDELRSAISTISATTSQTITFELTDGATVRWGDATENELKAAVLDTLMQVGARTYDVSAPRTPVTS